MDPRDSHFNRARYDPPPFHHHQVRHHDLPDPPDNYYPQPNFHPPPPPPPPRQHGQHRDHHPYHDPRLQFAPPFDPRIPAGPVARGPHHTPPPEFWDGPTNPADGRRVVEVYDDRRVHEPPPNLRESSQPRRYWVREGEAFGEGFRVRAQRQQVRIVDDHPDDPLEQELLYLPRVSRPGFVPNRGGEEFTNFDWQIPIPLPFEKSDVRVMNSDIGYHVDRYEGYEDRYVMVNKGKRKMPDVGPDSFRESHYMGDAGKRKMPDVGSEDHSFGESNYLGGAGKRKMPDVGPEDHSFRESHYMGGAGKRKNFNGGNYQYKERKRPFLKTSALGRIRSGVSVWSRIEEKPTSPPIDDISNLGFLDENENEREIDVLDLSYKSNSFVAKVVVPSSLSSTLPSESLGKGPKVVTPKDGMKKEKVATDREKVVIPIASGLAGPKKPKGRSPIQDSKHSEGSEKLEIGPSKLASGGSTPLSKKGTKCLEGSKKIITFRKTTNGSTPQSLSKKRPIATTSVKLTGGAGVKPVSVTKSSPKPVSNNLDGLERIIGYPSKPSGCASPETSSKKEIGLSCNIASGTSSDPLPKMRSSPLQVPNSSEGSKMVLASSSKPATAKRAVSSYPEPATVSDTQLLLNTENCPTQSSSHSDGSEKIGVPPCKTLNAPNFASGELASDVCPRPFSRTENIPHFSDNSFGIEKVLVSSTMPSAGSNSQPSSKSTVTAYGKPSRGANTQPALIKEGNPVHVSNDKEGSEKVVASSTKSSGCSSSQRPLKRLIAFPAKPGSKRVIKVASGKKSAAKRATKTVQKVGNHINKDSRQESKNSNGKPADGMSSQICQPGQTMVMASVVDSAAELISKHDNLVQSVGMEDRREEESSILAEKVDPNCCNPVVSDSRVSDDPSLQPLAEEVTVIRTQSKTIASFDNCIIEGSSRSVSLAEYDVGHSSPSDIGLTLSSFDKFSSLGLVGDPEDIRWTSTSGRAISFKFRNVKRKLESSEKEQVLEVPEVSKEHEILAEWMHENGDVILPLEVSNLDLTESLPNYALCLEDYAASLVGNDGRTPSDGMSILDESLVIHMNDLAGEIKELPLAPGLSENCILQDVSKLQDASNVMNTEWPDSKVTESEHCNANDDNDKQEEKPITNHDMKSDENIHNHQPIIDKAQLSSSDEQTEEELTADAKLSEGKTLQSKIASSYGVPNIFQNRVKSASSLNVVVRKNPNMRNKTWHRMDTSTAASTYGNLQYGNVSHRQMQKKQSPKKLGRGFNPSYVRKGNSLIRKQTNGVLPPLPPHGIDPSRSRSTHLTERACNPTFERPQTPPLPLGSKFPNCGMDPLKDFSQPVSDDLIPEAGVEAQKIPVESQNLDLIPGTMNNQSIPSVISSEPLTRKRMIYVKHKSNHLVAAHRVGIGNPSTKLAETTQKLSSSTPSDLYYRRKKNQLVLNASSDSQHKQVADNVNLDDQGTSKVFSMECRAAGLFKKRLDKVLRKTYKHSKFSRVWTLNGEQPDKKGDTEVKLCEVTPYLFPWKRTTYLKKPANRRSLSLIRGRLQFTRKMDTIYKVSTDGFSLRKAGVVSIGGSSLKWSKSIEKKSKKANEEATLAVAEAERRKRERQRSTSVHARKKNVNCLSRKSTFGTQLKQGERIFRVGSVRYKMDSSKRTLIRIPDEQSSCPQDLQSAKSTFVPRRLLIDNDEYIRIGNGNQLVRDPKKLVRILASEKVRWSLHTARLRLAKKQQYCQFFTRFGKCNKTAGKCPYIHDPAKVAICTKFLKGVCSNPDCKLTHKVIPERMPDCSYFLQGLCTNIRCPYRHVNVNPSASVCDGFLRGYCADGDECRKKHSYVCPNFETTGKCTQGSKCRLHHPKSMKKSKKRKRLQVQSNSRGRYFGADIVEVSEPLVAASEGGDSFLSDGWATEFISIDNGSGYDDVEANIPEDSSSKELDSDLSDMRTDDLDALIKPIRIMMKKVDSTNVPT